jgi:hypothetical protein
MNSIFCASASGLYLSLMQRQLGKKSVDHNLSKRDHTIGPDISVQVPLKDILLRPITQPCQSVSYGILFPAVTIQTPLQLCLTCSMWVLHLESTLRYQNMVQPLKPNIIIRPYRSFFDFGIRDMHDIFQNI